MTVEFMLAVVTHVGVSKTVVLAREHYTDGTHRWDYPTRRSQTGTRPKRPCPSALLLCVTSLAPWPHRA
jgi:hypothetical protein